MSHCQGNRLARRGFLGMGIAGGLGIGLSDLFHLQAVRGTESAAVAGGPTAKSLIHVFLPGGAPHQETFDPKPFAPIEYRGDLGVVATNTGDVFSSAMPQLASIADKITVIRSMTHPDAAHERGTHQMFTGYTPSPALIYPSMGSVVSQQFGPRNNLPPYVCIPSIPTEYAGCGYLSSAFAPFSLGDDPARGDFRVRDLDLPGDVPADRFTRRRAALEAVNDRFSSATSSDGVHAMNTFYDRAFSLLDSVDARQAFQISAETEEMRNRYGRHEPGQRLLLARRLIPAGVRLVTLTYGGWDLHNYVTNGIRGMMPPLDQALAALIQDLEASGLLSETVVMVSTEFGRTPKINATAGRDHWPRVFSVMVAGGGFKRGYVHGASSATASEPESDPVTPADLAATVYNQLGIDASKELMAPGNRPIEIVKGGNVIKELLA